MDYFALKDVFRHLIAFLEVKMEFFLSFNFYEYLGNMHLVGCSSARTRILFNIHQSSTKLKYLNLFLL